MSTMMLPSRVLIFVLSGAGCALAALGFAEYPHTAIFLTALSIAALIGALLAADIYLTMSRWRRSPMLMRRQLPRAFAVGVPVTLSLTFENPGEFRRRGQFYEICDSTLEMPDMPLDFDMGPGQRETL